MMTIKTFPFKFSVICFIILLSSCDKDAEFESAVAPKVVDSGTKDARKGGQVPSYTTYTIRKGQHSSNYSTFKSLSTNNLRFEAIFNSSAIYQTVSPNNQADINKLYGMSDCGSHHHTNSARFGWRWYNNRLEVLAYVYRNGTSAYKLIGAVDLDKAYQYELVLDGSNYVFKVNGLVDVVLPRGCSGKGTGYQLYPYFGGDEVAPHDITIKIRNL